MNYPAASSGVSIGKTISHRSMTAVNKMYGLKKKADILFKKVIFCNILYTFSCIVIDCIRNNTTVIRLVVVFLYFKNN